MSFLIVVGALFAVLFLASYLTSRRLGLLGLALAAGYVIASLWTPDVTPIVAQAGFEIIRPPLSSLVATFLTLLPATLVFFSGASTKNVGLRIASAIVFSALAIAFLAQPLGSALIVDATAKPIYEFIQQYDVIIVTVGLGASILDLMLGIKKFHRGSRH